MAMQVICTDGTVFTCDGFELTEYGVALYGQNLAREKERYDSEPEQTGYIPHDRLWYILPDDVEPNIPGLATGRGQPQHGLPQENHQQVPGQPQVGPGHGQQSGQR